MKENTRGWAQITLGFFSSVVKETKTEEEKISAKVWDLQQVSLTIIKSWHLKIFFKKIEKQYYTKHFLSSVTQLKSLSFWGPNPDLQSNRSELSSDISLIHLAKLHLKTFATSLGVV